MCLGRPPAGVAQLAFGSTLSQNVLLVRLEGPRKYLPLPARPPHNELIDVIKATESEMEYLPRLSR